MKVDTDRPKIQAYGRWGTAVYHGEFTTVEVASQQSSEKSAPRPQPKSRRRTHRTSETPPKGQIHVLQSLSSG